MKEALYMMLYTLMLSVVVSFAVATVIWFLTKMIDLTSKPEPESTNTNALDEELALVLAIAHANR